MNNKPASANPYKNHYSRRKWHKGWADEDMIQLMQAEMEAEGQP